MVDGCYINEQFIAPWASQITLSKQHYKYTMVHATLFSITKIIHTFKPKYHHFLEATTSLLLLVMVGKHQYFNFFLIFLFLSLFCIQYGISRPLNTLELKESIFMKSPHNMVVKNSLVVEGHKQNKNIRRLEIDNSGPSPDGPGH